MSPTGRFAITVLSISAVTAGCVKQIADTQPKPFSPEEMYSIMHTDNGLRTTRQMRQERKRLEHAAQTLPANPEPPTPNR